MDQLLRSPPRCHVTDINALVQTASITRKLHRETRDTEKAASEAYFKAQDLLCKELSKEVNEKSGGTFTARITLYTGK